MAPKVVAKKAVKKIAKDASAKKKKKATKDIAARKSIAKDGKVIKAKKKEKKKKKKEKKKKRSKRVVGFEDTVLVLQKGAVETAQESAQHRKTMGKIRLGAAAYGSDGKTPAQHREMPKDAEHKKGVNMVKKMEEGKSEYTD